MVNNIVLSVMSWGSSLKDAISTRLREESGQDLLEYAVLVGAIAAVAAGVLYAIGPTAFQPFADKVTACLTFDSTNCQ